MQTLEHTATDRSNQPAYLALGEGTHLSLMGDEQWHKISASQTGGRLFMFETQDAPGVGIPLHTHTLEDEIFYVLDGTYEFTVGNQRIVAEKGATLYAPRNVPHAWKVIGDRDARMLVMLLPGKMEQMFHELHAACAAGGAGAAAIPEICGNHGVTFAKAE